LQKQISIVEPSTCQMSIGEAMKRRSPCPNSWLIPLQYHYHDAMKNLDCK